MHRHGLVVVIDLEKDRVAFSLECAEVMFLIRRDGSVTSFRFLTRSGAYSFDLDAEGAVEAAGNARAFGPLPDGFGDDVLPVIFSFDPQVVH